MDAALQLALVLTTVATVATCALAARRMARAARVPWWLATVVTLVAARSLLRLEIDATLQTGDAVSVVVDVSIVACIAAVFAVRTVRQRRRAGLSVVDGDRVRVRADSSTDLAA